MTQDAAPSLAAASLEDGRLLSVRTADAAEADALVDLMHRAFRARPLVGARADALSDDTSAVAEVLHAGTGYVAEIDGEAVGLTLVTRREGADWLGRVCVVPQARRLGVASFLVTVILEHLAALGGDRVRLRARREYPELGRWWERHGFAVVGEDGNCHVMERELPVVARAGDADAMRALGRRLARALRPGDLLIATGELGAGKTTLAQGLGAGLDVAGPIISPTFVLARVHRSLSGGPALVHVDAYRLAGPAELEDLDLEASLDRSVTLVEWGAGVAEGLAESRLEIDIRRGADPADDTRWVFFTPLGPRWSRAGLIAALEGDA